MKNFFMIILLVFLMPVCLAEQSKVTLEKVTVNPNDIASIKRGAKFFATVCMVCHTLTYLRYDKIAKEAGIAQNKTNVNVQYFGMSPPDLSLITRIRGPRWVYTYLHSFYVDTTRPTGYNNLVFPNSVMPNFLAPYQGQQVLVEDTSKHLYSTSVQWYDLLVLQKQGSMNAEQFDQAMIDVVNFLAYAAEPYRADQMRMGYGVIGFLIILFIVALLLKRSYWKDITDD